MSSKLLRRGLILGLAALSLSAAAGGLVTTGRTAAPMAMQQAAAPGRMALVTEQGVVTTHTLRSQAAEIEGVIARGGLKDPLVMHRSTLAQMGAKGEGVGVITLKGPNYEYALTASGKSWAESVKEVAPEVGAWLQTRSLAPAGLQAAEGRWLIEVGGTAVPLRPPLNEGPRIRGAM